MDFSLEQAFGVAVVLVITAIGFIALGNFLEITENNLVLDVGESFFSSNVNDRIMGKEYPTLTISNIKINKGDTNFSGTLKPENFYPYVTATDRVDGDVKSSLKVSGEIDVNNKGTYKVRFSVENSVGLKTAYIKSVVVE